MASVLSGWPVPCRKKADFAVRLIDQSTSSRSSVRIQTSRCHEINFEQKDAKVAKIPADDYFISFGLDYSTWLEASFYADGMQEFLIDLQTYMSTSFALSLQGSTDFANVILWPEHLAGQAMFDYHPTEPKNVIGRLVFFVFGPPADQPVYSNVSLDALRDSVQEK